jgi:quercetin dioxygenase-like cupin family protein
MARRIFWAAPLLAVALASAGYSQQTLESLRLAPTDFDWPADAASTARIDIAGDRNEHGLYAYRVRFPAGFRNSPHFHPDDRIVTVIAGTLHVGFGNRFDESAMRALAAGSLWTEPGDRPHFVWAKDGEVVIQVIGYGPSGTTQVDP